MSSHSKKGCSDAGQKARMAMKPNPEKKRKTETPKVKDFLVPRKN